MLWGYAVVQAKAQSIRTRPADGSLLPFPMQVCCDHCFSAHKHPRPPARPNDNLPRVGTAHEAKWRARFGHGKLHAIREPVAAKTNARVDSRVVAGLHLHSAQNQSNAAASRAEAQTAEFLCARIFKWMVCMNVIPTRVTSLTLVKKIPSSEANFRPALRPKIAVSRISGPRSNFLLMSCANSGQ